MDIEKLKARLRAVCDNGCDPDLPFEAADTIESLQIELERSRSTIGIISGALSHTEREALKHNSKAQQLENENRRLKGDLEEMRTFLACAVDHADRWHSECRSGPVEGDTMMDAARQKRNEAGGFGSTGT